MGSSNSKSKPSSSSSSSSNSNNHNNKPLRKVKVAVAPNDEHKQGNCLLDTAHLERMVKEADASIAKDPSLPNVLYQFAKLLQKPSLQSFEEIVSASKENWSAIVQVLEQSPDISPVRVAAMQKIYKDYWALLLRTRLGIEVLIKKCKLQQRNVAMLLEIVAECRANKGAVLSADDQMARRECIQQLGKWLKIDEIDTLVKEWSNMETQVELEQKHWKNICANASTKQRQKMSWLVSAFANVARQTRKAKLFVLRCGGASDATIAAAASSPLELTVARVQKLLRTMNKGSKKFQVELNKMKCDAAFDEDYEVFKNNQSLRRIESSLEAITEYLGEYITQGRAVISTVDQACQVMINC